MLFATYAQSDFSAVVHINPRRCPILTRHHMPVRPASCPAVRIAGGLQATDPGAVRGVCVRAVFVCFRAPKTDYPQVCMRVLRTNSLP